MNVICGYTGTFSLFLRKDKNSITIPASKTIHEQNQMIHEFLLGIGIRDDVCLVFVNDSYRELYRVNRKLSDFK